MRRDPWPGRTAGLLAAMALGATALQFGAGCGPAAAAGFALKEQSAIDQGASFAGASARADDPSTLFFNPAGMTQLPGYQISISGSLIAPQANLNSGFATANSPFGPLPLGGTASGEAAQDQLLPSFYATAEVAPDWHVGLAVNSPFGLTTKYDTNSAARYYALTSYLRTYDFTPSVAWRALPQLSVSAGLQVEVADARLSSAQDFGLIGAGLGIPGFAPGKNDGIATVKGNDTAVGWQAGLLYEPLAGTRIGFDYRSAVFHTLSGSVNFQGVPAPLTAVPTFAGGSGTAKVATPDIISLGVAQDIGDFTVLAQLDYTLWSRFKNLLVVWPTGTSLTQENWNNAVTASLGADWRVAPDWTLRTGVAFDQSPVTAADRTPRIPDNNRYWLSIGATWKPMPKLAISAAYTHIFVSNSSVNLADLGPGTANYLRGNLAAAYTGEINMVSLQGTFSF